MSNVQARRNYKDSLFRKIFSGKEELLQLYNAVNGSVYRDPQGLIISTIEDVLYLGMKNDVSFLIDRYLNLYEAQSSWNPNMPLRGLFYFSQLYHGYVAEHQLDIFSKKQLELPAPRYVVFYNGASDGPDRSELRLSDSYQQKLEGAPCLECTAVVLNINYGKNEILMKNCRKLYEYAYLVERVRFHLRQGLIFTAAVDTAVLDCIEHDILKPFLLKHRGEVTNMILEEDAYLTELHIRSEKKLSFEEGQQMKLVQQVCRKLSKGKSVEAIAEALEEDPAVIAAICESATAFAPEYDSEKVFAAMEAQR